MNGHELRNSSLLLRRYLTDYLVLFPIESKEMSLKSFIDFLESIQADPETYHSLMRSH